MQQQQQIQRQLLELQHAQQHACAEPTKAHRKSDASPSPIAAAESARELSSDNTIDSISSSSGVMHGTCLPAGAVKEQDHLQVTLMNSTTTHDSKVTSSSLFGSVMSPPHAPSQSSSQNSSAFMSAQARHEAQGRGQPERLVHEY